MLRCCGEGEVLGSAGWSKVAVIGDDAGDLRDRYRNLPETRLIAALAHVRPDRMNNTDAADTMFALRSLARRYLALAEDISDLEERMRARATAANSALMAIKGIGPVIGAQLLITAGDNPARLRSSASFAVTALCGTAPSLFLQDAPIGTASLEAATDKRTRHCTTS